MEILKFQGKVHNVDPLIWPPLLLTYYTLKL